MHDFVPLISAGVTHETRDAISVRFNVPDVHRARFAFKPGQHVNVRAMLDGADVRRSYSICSDPNERDLRIAIKRVDGGHFSTWAHATLRHGMTLDVSPPAGRFALVPGDGTSRYFLAIAAGSGITPIISMVRHALLTEPATRVTLLYGNRTIDEIIFRGELEDLKDRFLARFTLVHILSRGEQTDTPVLEGRIDGDKVRALVGPVASAGLAHAYICGPGSLIKDARNALFALGMPRDRVHHEFFAAGGGAYRTLAPATTKTGPATEVTTESATEVVVTLDGQRHRFTVAPGEAVIDGALRAGLRVPYACKGGMCCTCRAQIVEGKADMRVNYSLEAWEIAQGFVLTCQAVATTPRLVLDYDRM